MDFNNYERSIMLDAEFFRAKHNVVTKITALMDNLNHKINFNIHKHSNSLSKELIIKLGKISRGENYKLLPYLVLDTPALFSKKDIFVFRTMFWWGNEISFTLHLQGKHMEAYLNKILANWELLTQDEFYFCINSSPWEYHFGEDNYKLISAVSKDDILTQAQQHNFIKISYKIPVSEITHLPEKGFETFEKYMHLIS